MAHMIAFAGSTRKGSINFKLADAAVQVAIAQGATAELIDFSEYDMPLYNGDWENDNGVPEAAKALAKKINEADAIFIASPEYNGSFSSLLKNTIDWVSRVKEDNRNPFNDKFVALGASSPGPRGGLTGLTPLRMLMSYLGSIVMPTQVAVGDAASAYDNKNQLTNPKIAALLEQTIKSLLLHVNK